MKPSRIIPILWLVVTVGVALAAAQDWYEVIAPIPGLKKTVATGIESFPLLASIPWLALLCLGLIWYLGTIGKLLVALLTAILSLAGAAQILLSQTNPQVLISKIETHTGITQTVHFVERHTRDLGTKNLVVVLLITLAFVAMLTIFSVKQLPTRNQGNPRSKDASKTQTPRTVWDQQDS